MSYLAGVLAALGVIAATNRLMVRHALRMPFAALSFFKIEYLAAGMVLSALFPESFANLFARTQSTLIMFCVSWLGLYFGCGLESRVLRTFPPSAILLSMAGPVFLFVIVASAGTLYLYFHFDSWDYTGVALLTGVFSSFTLFRRHGFLEHTGADSSKHILQHLSPAGNVFPVLALGIISIALFTAREVTVIDFTFNGTFAVILLHLLFGIATGILLNMLTAASDKPSRLPMILAGCAALVGGIAYTFSLSPLLLSTLAGAFLMNATLKRLQVLDALTTTTAYVERTVMFLIGSMIFPLITLMGSETLIIALYACALTAFRMSLTFVFSWLWSHRLPHLSGTSPDLWIGLTGQGFLAAAAAVECSLQVHLLPSVFLFFVFVLLANQLTIGVYTRAGSRSSTAAGAEHA